MMLSLYLFFTISSYVLILAYQNINIKVCKKNNRKFVTDSPIIFNKMYLAFFIPIVHIFTSLGLLFIMCVAKDENILDAMDEVDKIDK